MRQSLFHEPRWLDKPGVDEVRLAVENVRLGFLNDAIAELKDQTGSLLERTPRTIEAYCEVLSGVVEMVSQQQAALDRRLLGAASRAKPYHLSGSEDLARLEIHSTAQLGQDLWALEQSNFKRGGFFVEFGATDGVLLSNTYMLEKLFGWRGICVEPHPRYYERLQKNRDCKLSNALIGGRTGDKVDFILANEFSTIDGYSHDQHDEKRQAFVDTGSVIQLETVSLDELLEDMGAPREIDFLSIDTEGSEYDILKSFPFDKWHVQTIAVEHNFSGTRESIYELLTSKGFKRTEAQWDDWYYRD